MRLFEKVGVGVENVVMRLARLYFLQLQPKYFWRGELDEKVDDFASIVKVACVEVDRNIEGWKVRCNFGREERVTKVFQHNDYNREKPNIIWHHGAGNVNYGWQMRIFLNGEIFEKYNVFSVKAAHHQDRKDYLANCMDSFTHWQMTFTGSVLAEQEVVKYCRQHGKQPVIITGESMGGIVASWHWLVFNSADYYFPIVAYPNVGKIFMGNSYKNGIDRRTERLRNQNYFTAYSLHPRSDSNITPILGRYDQIITIDEAQEYWQDHNPVIFPTGHATIALEAREIRRMILEKVSG